MRRRATLLVATGLLLAACGADLGASPTPTPRELPAGPADLTPGSYALADFPVALSFELPALEPPAVWFACWGSLVEQAVCTEPTPGAVVAVTFQIVENVVAGCSDQETAELLDPPVGPSVDDLVTAISNLEGYEATEARDITVSGFAGKEFTLTAVRHACGATWSTADRITGMGAGEINLLRAIDVDGERVLIAGAYDGRTPEETLATMERVMDSIQVEP